MKRVTLFCGLLLAAASIAAGSWYGRREASASDLRARTVLYYVDPMHPAYRSDKPGTAPDCGMALEPVYEGSPRAATRAGDPAVVRVSPDTQKQLGVRVQTVEKASGTERLRLYGRVAPDETRQHRRGHVAQVEQHQREHIAAAGLRDQALQFVVEQAAVGQAGESVVVGQLLEPLLTEAQFGGAQLELVAALLQLLRALRDQLAQRRGAALE